MTTEEPSGIAQRASRAIYTTRTRAATLLVQVSSAMNATRVGARGTTSALQVLPDSTLRWLTASSVGLGAGLYLAGAPRLISAAGVSPALLMGAAIATRRIKPGVAPQG